MSSERVSVDWADWPDLPCSGAARPGPACAPWPPGPCSETVASACPPPAVTDSVVPSTVTSVVADTPSSPEVRVTAAAPSATKPLVSSSSSEDFSPSPPAVTVSLPEETSR